MARSPGRVSFSRLQWANKLAIASRSVRLAAGASRTVMTDWPTTEDVGQHLFGLCGQDHRLGEDGSQI
jgi:hypothetical protein